MDSASHCCEHLSVAYVRPRLCRRPGLTIATFLLGLAQQIATAQTTDPIICGTPAFDAGSDRAAFIWKDCTDDNELHFYVTGGGVKSATVFTGEIESIGGYSAVNTYKFEANDAMNTTGDLLSYNLRVWDRDTDGIDFFSSPGACLTPSPSVSFPLYIGKNRTLATDADVDLDTGLSCAAAVDTDGDGLSDVEEAGLGTDPALADTDTGGAEDGAEVAAGNDPLDPSDDANILDGDNDQLSDAEEQSLGTDPANPDTDGGGAQDGAEVAAATDPLNPADDATLLDSDSDGLTDAEEQALGTNPLVEDTDGGGVNDGDEVAAGTNPLNPADDIQADPAICGQPTMNASTDRAAFVWRDCDTDGELHFLASGGGVQVSTYFSGEIISPGGFNQVTPQSLESNDILNVSGDTLIFTLGVWNSGSDGIHFFAQPGACLTPDTSGFPLYIGADRTPFAGADIDLSTGQECIDAVDSDGDGLPDIDEENRGTDPNDPDTDNGGANDGLEVTSGTNPLDAADDATLLDSDDDGLSDADEATLGTNPLVKDSDGGGAEDGAEVSSGTDPLNPADDLLVDPIICGEPGINAGSDRAAFIWKDCDSDGTLHYRVAGGGVQSTTVFAGEVYSIGGFPSYSAYSFESDDVVTVDGYTMSFRLNVWGQGSDGIDLQAKPFACLTPASPASFPLYVGADRIPADSDVDLTTGLACSDPVDTDGDGINDLEEAVLGTNPEAADTDSGGADDGIEVAAGTDPLDPADDATVIDSDGDGLSDAEEASLGTDPLDPDSDGGGADDATEVAAGANPLDSSDDLTVLDNDNDQLSDAEELLLGTDPHNPDTDGGGAEDNEEVLAGTDPLDPGDDLLAQGLGVDFEDVSESAGFGGFYLESWGSAWGDINGDYFPDVVMTDHRVPGRFYLNNTDGTFDNQSSYVDISNAFHNTRRDTHAANWVDYDNDGDQDMAIAVGTQTSLGSLLGNDNGRLTEKRNAAGLNINDGGEQRMPVFFDFNNDGLLDLKVINLHENSSYNTVYRQNANHTFSKASNAAGLRCNNSDWAQFIDVNGSGQLEMMCGNRDGKFPIAAYDYTSGYGTNLNLAQTTLVSDAITGDFNGDLKPDIVAIRGQLRTNSIHQADNNTAELHSIFKWNGNETFKIKTTGTISFSVNASSNKNWLMPNKVGNGMLDETFIGSSGYHPGSANISLNPANTNNHGLLNPGQRDGLFIGYDPGSGEWTIRHAATGQYSYVYLTVTSSAPITSVSGSGYISGHGPMTPKYLLNSGGNFVDATAGSGLESVRCISGVAGDFDNDKDQDLYMACRTGTANLANVFFANIGDGTFRKVELTTGAEGAIGAAVADAAGNAESVTVVDYDVDGFLDLFVTNGLNMVPELIGGDEQLFRNLGNNNNWLLIDLVGTASNRNGMGAKIRVTSDGIAQYREQNGGYHRWAQNHPRIHVGLGRDVVAEEIQITWPSGVIDTYTNVAANRLYRATEATGIEAIVIENN